MKSNISTRSCKMDPKRTKRVNSLLKEVISESILHDVKHPSLKGQLISVTKVEVTNDLCYADVYLSVIGEKSGRSEIAKALTSAAGFIAVRAAKKVSLRFFPELRFKFDDSVEKHMRIDDLLREIKK